MCQASVSNVNVISILYIKNVLVDCFQTSEHIYNGVLLPFNLNSLLAYLNYRKVRVFVCIQCHVLCCLSINGKRTHPRT